VVRYQETLKNIHSNLNKLGDLPVFSATLNRIEELSSSPESDAMALAMAILKDAGLSAKLLRIANTSEFNRGAGEVSVISRAVIILGFERIKNLSITMKLIESFTQTYPDSHADTLLLRSFLNASMARELASKARMRDVEEVFLCGLMFSLGEIIVSCTLPESYATMLKMRKAGRQRWSAIQLSVLGCQFSDIGQDLAQSWGFPSSVIKTMDELTAEDHKNISQRHRLIATCHTLTEKIYSKQSGGLSTDELAQLLIDDFGLQDNDLEYALDSACKLAADMVDEYGINTTALVPQLHETGDARLDDIVRHTAYFFHSRKQLNQKEGAAVQRQIIKSENLEKQLNYLNTLAEMVDRKASASEMLAHAVDGIKHCTSYHRVIFCLYRAQTSSLLFKIGEGDRLESLERYFSAHQQEPALRLFLQVIKKGMTLLIPDMNEPGWRERLPQVYIDGVQPTGMVVTPVVVAQKPIGILYADKQDGVLEDKDFSCFNQFAIQLKIALAHRS
jgi:HD-like signal output (HDOD) protein